MARRNKSGFKNPPGLVAGWIITRIGVRGYFRFWVQVSSLGPWRFHPTRIRPIAIPSLVVVNVEVSRGSGYVGGEWLSKHFGKDHKKCILTPKVFKFEVQMSLGGSLLLKSTDEQWSGNTSDNTCTTCKRGESYIPLCLSRWASFGFSFLLLQVKLIIWRCNSFSRL
jgi:hypothetical protein